MFRRLTTALLVAILAYSHVVDAKTDELLQMKVFNHDFRPSGSEMHAILNKADLTGNGFKLEVVTKLVDKASGGQDYQKAHYYYKDVDCSKVQEVEQELERLLPAGVIGKDVGNRFKTEAKNGRCGSTGQCRVGLEVHFKNEEDRHNNSQKDVSKQRKKRGFSDWCIICIACITSN